MKGNCILKSYCKQVNVIILSLSFSQNLYASKIFLYVIAVEGTV